MSAELLNNRYRLETEIGHGGMGSVYQGYDMLLDRPVAVKVLSEAGVGSQGRERLLREAKAVAKLNHPNIVSVYDAGTSDGVGFVVMEYVEGTSLHKLRPEAMDDIVSTALQVARALEHAHSHGIIHRDLKPENVMVTPDGTVKLMDFGLARSIASRITSEGNITGTVYYMSPEQALGQPVDGRTDLYSFGVMLYELTTGRLPFVADDPLAIISQHLHAPVVPPSTYNEQVPPVLETLILALLAKEPDDRPASAAEVGQALGRLGATAPEAGEPINAIDRLVRGRMVGRRREVAQARAEWRKAAAGDSRVLLISGEPGIGKTRLVRELISQVTVTGGIVLACECHSGGSAPYAPLAQMIEQAIERLAKGGLPARALADLIRLAPSLQPRFPDVPPNPPLDPQADQHRLCDSVFLLMSWLAQQAPVTLVVEDIHWADSGTLSLLRYLTSRGHACNLALLSVLTYREADTGGASILEDLLHELRRANLATHISLARFNKEQTAELLAVILQCEPFPQVVDIIDQETDGNPFFIEEVSKALIEQGRLVHESGLWQYREGPEGPAISRELRASIHYRVGRLPEQVQEVLRVAAMIGREFDCDVLEEVCQLGEEALIAALESAERAQFIEELPPRRGSRHRTCLGFSFVHAIVQHALEESVTGLRRQRSHARIAQALELLRREDLDELASALARHFAGAGDWERAAECWARAGDRALGLFAYPEAIRAYRQALDVFKDRQDLEHAAKTLMKLGLVHQALSEFDAAHLAFQEGSALWQLVPPIPTASLPAAPHAFRKTDGLLATLDPMHVDGTWELTVAFSLFRGLVERTPEMSILPDAARAWDILEGGRRYVFHLREDVRWTDGLPTTAHDFEYAWKRCLDPHSRSPMAQLLYDIQGARAHHTGEAPTSEAVGVRATDDFTLLVDLEHPVGYFLHLACSLFPVPRHVVEAHGAAWANSSQIVTNGAFLVDEWRPGDRVTLVRNPAFVGRFSGNLHRVEIKMDLNLDPLACRQRYEAGENDWYCPQMPAEEDRARYMYPGEYFISPLAYTTFLLLDPGQAPFDDPRVRHAFAHALDRVTHSNVVTGGYLPPALGGLVPPGLPGHLPQTGLSHDPDRARELLAAAGYPGGRGFPEVRLAVAHSEGNTQPWQHLQGQWRTALGVNVVVAESTTEESRETTRGAPAHMKLSAWVADYPDPDNFLRVCLDQLMGTRWHAAFHELIERARRTINQSERIALYQQADRLLIEEAVVLPLVYGRYSFFLKPWVRRFPTCPIVSDFSKDIIIEPH